MSWTDERIATLKKMWEGGSTASQIADELGGVSRNAVIGKAHRLGLKARPSPVKANAKKKARRKGARPSRRAKKLGPRARPRTDHGRRTSATPQAAASARQLRAGRRRRSRRAIRSPCPIVRNDAQDRLGRTRRLPAPGPGRPAAADSPGSAAPPGAGQAQSGDRGQDQPARSVAKRSAAGRWVIRAKPIFHFCGTAVNPGFPYCVEHCGRAYQAQLPRGARRPPPPLPFGGPRVR